MAGLFFAFFASFFGWDNEPKHFILTYLSPLRLCDTTLINLLMHISGHTGKFGQDNLLMKFNKNKTKVV